MRSLYLAIVATLLFSSPVFANDVILLGEVLPALADTEIGAIEVGNAPPHGSSRRVRRSEVLAALRRAGRTADGLAIPRSVLISRESRTVDRDDAAALALPAVSAALAPCTVESIRMPHDVRLSAGAVEVRATGNAPRRSGSATAVVVFTSGGSEVRLPVRARVTCPPPAITAGESIQLRIRVGNVIATAGGESRQPGRIGEIIRVTNASTRASLRGRVINDNTVEVIQ